jgi:hypothetical protein
MKPLFAVLPLLLAAPALIAFAQDGPDQKPNVFLQNDRTKPQKQSTTRLIDGTIKDAAGNPIADAIVQLKNTKTSSVVEFVTKDDGRYAFRDLPMDINFDLLAKHNDLITPVKKVSIYDTRNHIILNFELAPAKP